MKKLSKMIALSLAGVMLVSLPVLAAPSPSRGGSSSAEETAAREAAAIESAQQREAAAAAEAAAIAAQASGIPTAVAAAASGERKTVGEFNNNAVAELPGLSNVVPVAQGGHVIINGAPSNQTFAVLKPADAAVASAKDYAATLGGTVLNVARVNASVGFNTATVNFYMPGVTADNNIQVVQLVNGQWNPVTVAEVRADHVVVDLTSLGTLAFVQVAAQ